VLAVGLLALGVKMGLPLPRLEQGKYHADPEDLTGRDVIERIIAKTSSYMT
jgi:hypothetical protein